MNRIFLKPTKITIFNYLFAICMMFFAAYAPKNFFEENSLIEGLESIALLLGIFFCFIEYRKNRAFKSVFLTFAFILIIFIGRELSWGRVFFTNEAGDVIKRKDWFLGNIMYFIQGFVFLGILAHAIKTKFINNIYILLMEAQIMIYDFLLVILMAGASILFESYYKFVLPTNLYNLHISFEESAEIAMYFAISLIIYSYSKYDLLKNIKDA